MVSAVLNARLLEQAADTEPEVAELRTVAAEGGMDVDAVVVGWRVSHYRLAALDHLAPLTQLDDDDAWTALWAVDELGVEWVTEQPDEVPQAPLLRATDRLLDLMFAEETPRFCEQTHNWLNLRRSVEDQGALYRRTTPLALGFTSVMPFRYGLVCAAIEVGWMGATLPGATERAAELDQRITTLEAQT